MTGRGRVDADILQQDVNGLADAHPDLWRELDGCRILITGGTGFVGSFILHLIAALRRRHGLHIDVLAVVRSRKRLRDVLGDDWEDSWLQVVEQDLRAPLSLQNEGPIEYCIHAASNADPVAYQSDPMGTMMTNVVGTEQILQYLADLDTKPFRVVYLSSVEAYGGHSQEGILKEDDTGSFDPAVVRNCYPISKLAAENLCAGARLQLGLPVTVARMAYLYGPGDRLNDPKIVTLFLRMLQEGRDIEMHSPGLQRRSYCYIKDAVYGIMLLLLRGQDSTYNIANGGEEVTIAGVAQKLTQLFGRPGGLVRYEQPDQDELARFSPPEDNILDTSKMRALGFEAEVGLAQGLERTGRYFGMRPSTWQTGNVAGKGMDNE